MTSAGAIAGTAFTSPDLDRFLFIGHSSYALDKLDDTGDS